MYIKSYWILGALMTFSLIAGDTKHCYICQSRGDSGDCKDPYITDAGISLKQIQPCFTGWCMKQMDTDGSFPGTSRSCMVAPPEDNVPRCTKAVDESQPGFPKNVYTCYCKGDLCNAAIKLEKSSYAMIPFFFGAMVLIF